MAVAGSLLCTRLLLVRRRRMCAMASDASEAIERAPVDKSLAAPPPRTKDPLLTMTNFKKVLASKGPITDVDHYARLQVPWQAPTSQIAAAFKERVDEVMALKEDGWSDDAIRDQLQQLQQSFDVLTSERQRRLYDWSILQEKNKNKRYVWPYEADITQKYSLPDPPVDEEDMDAIRKVGYFFLGWFVLSIFLGVFLH
ncbi:NAD(P)H-quinone oxidoreductase subunit U, chloroplastic-like [Selaginella moellendorffii]|uniref:NAD(P)H-quinone oxidoreductase subunit U, chloroplastic-like n=1 Tax=Selaginella moellendorffii TaxID=88036 RepID=UPI000D1C5D13|nr:NAD(P)H-quinone oxidoreductase subunit U, chloroplastic-like [Selaginella moellendorffii]|eukprot:XP_024524124.1 NAD(P)H-quinone oxidoreductase subunit U, chloroplastic-like [Selaginella moellendorffii]